MATKKTYRASMDIPLQRSNWDVTVNSNNSQAVEYNVPDLPIELHSGQVSRCKNMRCSCHWHNDLEFIIMKSGKVEYYVNDTVYRLNSDSMIMTNSNRMHFGTAINNREATFISLLLHPSLLSSSTYMEREYVNPILYNREIDAILFSPEVPWQGKCIDLMKHIVSLLEEQSISFGLEMQRTLFEFWHILYENTVSTLGANKQESHNNKEIKAMVEFINKNFTQPITLQNIADAGIVCRSKCCALFKKYLHQTAFEYLLNVRIENGIKLLNKREHTVSEIAMLCGFNNSSYFTETFHKITGETPSDYLKRLKTE